MITQALFHMILLQVGVININSTIPCFLNYTANNTFQTCGLGKDFLQASLVGWQWITGGNFSMIIAAIFCAFTYIKYHKIIYPMIIGVLMLPISYFAFPQTFINYAFIMLGVGIGVLIWYMFISQSNEN